MNNPPTSSKVKKILMAASKTANAQTNALIPPCPCCNGSEVAEVDLSTFDYEGPGIECRTCSTLAPKPAWMSAPRASMFEPATLESFGYDIQVFDYDARQEARITLPFAPFVGLRLKVPFELEEDIDYAIVDEVYWDGDRFVVYLAEGKAGKGKPSAGEIINFICGDQGNGRG